MAPTLTLSPTRFCRGRRQVIWAREQQPHAAARHLPLQGPLPASPSTWAFQVCAWEAGLSPAFQMPFLPLPGNLAACRSRPKVIFSLPPRSIMGRTGIGLVPGLFPGLFRLDRTPPGALPRCHLQADERWVRAGPHPQGALLTCAPVAQLGAAAIPAAPWRHHCSPPTPTPGCLTEQWNWAPGEL